MRSHECLVFRAKLSLSPRSEVDDTRVHDLWDPTGAARSNLSEDARAPTEARYSWYFAISELNAHPESKTPFRSAATLETALSRTASDSRGRCARNRAFPSGGGERGRCPPETPPEPTVIIRPTDENTRIYSRTGREHVILLRRNTARDATFFHNDVLTRNGKEKKKQKQKTYAKNYCANEYQKFSLASVERSFAQRNTGSLRAP